MLMIACLILPVALFGFGVKAILNFGYHLFGGRESFGWGSRIAGAVLMAPGIIVTIFFIVALKTGFITATADGATDNVVWGYVVTILSSLAGFVISYTIAEMTYVPYWVLSRREEDRNKAADEEDEADLSDRQKRKRKEKLERKRAKARELEEKLRKEREAEEERLKQRQERAKLGNAPPPMPKDDQERRRR